jgi:hypothetical protein
MLMQKLEEMAQAITSYKSHKGTVSRHEEALRNKKQPALQTLLETRYLKSCVEEPSQKVETVVSSEATPRQHSMTVTFKQALGCRTSFEKADTNHCSSVQEKCYPESHQVS